MNEPLCVNNAANAFVFDNKMYHCSARLNLKVSIAVCSLIAAISTQVSATEGGGSVYPVGVNTVLAGKMPPPGLTNFVYLSSYNADETKNGDGHNKSNISNFDLNVQALSLRMDYVYSDYSIFGATLASRIAVPFVKGDISFDVGTPRGRVHRSGKEEGMGDVTLIPLILGWGSPRFSQMVGVDIFAPIGKYDKDAIFNPGRNTWAYAPWYAFTAYPLEKLEVSSKMLYVINESNPDTHYRSGKEFNADYNVAYNFTKEWQVGVSGYLYKQLSDDRQYGSSVADDGNRGQVVAFGPSIKYQTPSFGLVFKWQHETLVENKAKGDRIWLQTVFRF